MTNWICLLGPSPWGARAVVAEGRRLVVLVPPGAVVPAEVVTHATSLEVTDITDVAAVRDTIRRLRVILGPPELVISFTEFGQIPAAHIATELGLPTVPIGAAAAAANKALLRQHLASTDWAWPFHSGTRSDLASFLADHLDRAPWIVKPVDSAGSAGVDLITNNTELRRWSTTADGWPPDQRWIAEQQAHGPEISVEAVSRSGRHDILGITAKETTGPPRFVETGHVLPAYLSPDSHAAVVEAAHATLDAIELTHGASHTELRLDPHHGPVIIETHTRPGGDSIPALTHLVTGRDQYRETLSALLDTPPPAPDPSVADAAAIAFLLPPMPGRLTGIHLDEGVDPGAIVELDLTCHLGATMTSVTSSADRIGHVVVTSDDPTAAQRLAAKIVSAIELSVTPWSSA